MKTNVLYFGDTDRVRVSFDGERMGMGSIGEVLEANGSSPKYIVALDSNGTQFLIYIPHFSEHLIEIESLKEHIVEKVLSSENYMVMAFALLIFLALISYVYKRGKG